MRLSLQFKKPKIVEVGPTQGVYKRRFELDGPQTEIKTILVSYIYDAGEDYTIPEILRAAADWYEKSENTR